MSKGPTDSQLETIRERIEKTYDRLSENGYGFTRVTPLEFYNYLTGETFSGDKTTIFDILASDYYVIHEVIEIGELKKHGLEINRNTVIQSPKDDIYEAHFKAFELELLVAYKDSNLDWIGLRMSHLKKILEDDPWMPKGFYPVAQSLYDEYTEKMRLLEEKN